ncbi:MAG: hypothetical protein SPI71_06065 [Acidaminococcaceae bacterium]|nr:hypothetical protein [Acidaminococcaceae bacterium]
MDSIANVDPVLVCSRVMQIFFGAFIYIYAVAKFIGVENKVAWFRKRKKYTFFNRRGIFGEDINFGYPVTWQGVLVFLVIYVPILGLGYWYVFMLPY